MQTPICEGCDYELWDAVVCENKRPIASLILDRLEQLTSLSFDEYRLVEIERTIQIMTETPDADMLALGKYQSEAERLRSILKRSGRQ